MDKLEFEEIKIKVEKYEALELKRSELSNAIRIFINTKNDKYSSVNIEIKGNSVASDKFITFIYGKNQNQLIDAIIHEYEKEIEVIKNQIDLLK